MLLDDLDGKLVEESYGQVVDSRSVDGKRLKTCNINMSSIYSLLIKEAAKCDHYASDVVIDIESVEEQLKNAQTSWDYFFGFRDMGVDGPSFVKIRLEKAASMDETPYRALYRLVCTPDADNKDFFTAKLYELYKREEAIA